MASRRRLDLELVRRGLVDSRALARLAIRDGRVLVDGAPTDKAARQVGPEQALVVTPTADRWVSRGAHKLLAALAAFDVDVAGRQCLDAGASTGGFTQVLLEHGAAHVVAVDVGYGQLADLVRNDPRVTVVERTNVRDLTPDDLPRGPVELVVADLSFISLRTVLPALRALATDNAGAVLLLKPQFEVGRAHVGKGGVVRDAARWRAAIEDVAAVASSLGWHLRGVIASPARGPAGNVEFPSWFDRSAPAGDVDAMLDAAIADGEKVRDA